MARYLIVGIASGILFGILDAAINANPLAQRLFQVYKPIARTSMNIAAGFIIDIIFGLAMGFVFLLLYRSLPGNSGLIKGLAFGLIIWFFRVLMNVASTGMMFKVPMATLVYVAVCGLIEMSILGVVYGIFLKPMNT